jgi:hypothetical protein
MKKSHAALLFLTGALTLLKATSAKGADAPLCISGRYPHLAMFNNQGECGTGAVVPWADHLWVITYAPHKPKGSDDKLYEIDADLNRITRPESVGGTPADRLIHRESNQLIIGPYFIDAQANVRAIPPSAMPARITAAARDLTDPAGKVYFYDMEGALFEADVKTLAVTKLFARAADGHHGKGAYTGQDRLVIANNGNVAVNHAHPQADLPGYAADPESSGALAQWDGKQWKMIIGREFTEVTGPGGIEGSPDNHAPIWALGWDKRSVMLDVLDGGTWHTYRLPIADDSYVAPHGWYTEWPRIREVGNSKMLMNMHGQWFDFPKTFSAANTAGIRPLGDYLKITGDFCNFNGKIVFGCDDASMMLNPLLGQSQSNLWFTTWDGLSKTGRPDGEGSLWLNDAVKANQPSAAYLFAGYDRRTLHLSQTSDQDIQIKIEIDADGHGNWTPDQTLTIPAHGYVSHIFPQNQPGEWARLTADRDCAGLTATFTYTSAPVTTDPATFASIRDAGDQTGCSGYVRPAAENRQTLLFQGRLESVGPKMFEVGSDMNFKPDSVNAPAFPAAPAIVKISEDDASMIVMQGKNRVRLPRSDRYVKATGDQPRDAREVVTERYVFNVGGSFYMLPRPDSSFALLGMKPIATHDKQITDFCSWKGMMVIAGTRGNAKPDGHYFGKPDGPGLWFGDIDDLWRMGKPRGKGGPWMNTPVDADIPSDPYLMAGYDHKSVIVSTDSPQPVKITIEVDPAASGTWNAMKILDIPPGQKVTYEFQPGYSAHWVRVRSNTTCHATAQFSYD